MATDENETAIPGELLVALEYAEMADALAAPILRVVERIHEKRLGKKVGQLLGILAQEIVDIATPVYSMVEARQDKIRKRRKDFVYDFMKASPYDSGTTTNAEMVKAAVEILRLEKNEYESLAKTIEISGLKGQLAASKKENSSDVDLSSLLAKLRNRAN